MEICFPLYLLHVINLEASLFMTCHYFRVIMIYDNTLPSPPPHTDTQAAMFLNQRFSILICRKKVCQWTWTTVTRWWKSSRAVSAPNLSANGRIWRARSRSRPCLLCHSRKTAAKRSISSVTLVSRKFPVVPWKNPKFCAVSWSTRTWYILAWDAASKTRVFSYSTATWSTRRARVRRPSNSPRRPTLRNIFVIFKLAIHSNP